MPVYSMTGYASGQLQAHSTNELATAATAATGGGGPGGNALGIRLGLEVRSVNSRFLDLTFKLPDDMRQQEPALREWVNARFKRGKLEIRVSLDSLASTSVLEPSTRLLQRLSMVQSKVTAWLPDAAPLSVAAVLKYSGNESREPKDWTHDLMALTAQVLTQLTAAREREGERLASMLRERLAGLRELAARALPMVPQLAEIQRQRFLERWKDALALASTTTLPEAAQERALTEAAAFAIRADVSEELTRLGSHIEEVSRLLEQGGELGKRLDFLIQEMHREANTMGSKSAALELTRISVDMKVLIEQMREQVQNIE